MLSLPSDQWVRSYLKLCHRVSPHPRVKHTLFSNRDQISWMRKSNSSDLRYLREAIENGLTDEITYRVVLALQDRKRFSEIHRSTFLIGQRFLLCSHDQIFGNNKNRIV